MTEAEWIRYLDTLPGEWADLARHIVERCASVIASEQRRHLVAEDSEHDQRIAADQDLRNVDNNARMVAEDQEARITAIEGEAAAPAQRTE